MTPEQHQFVGQTVTNATYVLAWLRKDKRLDDLTRGDCERLVKELDKVTEILYGPVLGTPTQQT